MNDKHNAEDKLPKQYLPNITLKAYRLLDFFLKNIACPDKEFNAIEIKHLQFAQTGEVFAKVPFPIHLVSTISSRHDCRFFKCLENCLIPQPPQLLCTVSLLL